MAAATRATTATVAAKLGGPSPRLRTVAVEKVAVPSVLGLLSARTEACPTKNVLRTGAPGVGDRVTMAELRQKTLTVARGMRELRLGPGEGHAVLLSTPLKLQGLCLQLAGAIAGSDVYVFNKPTTSAQAWSAALDASKARVVYCGTEDTIDALREAAPDNFPEEQPGTAQGYVAGGLPSARYPFLRHGVHTGKQRIESFLRWRNTTMEHVPRCPFVEGGAEADPAKTKLVVLDSETGKPLHQHTVRSLLDSVHGLAQKVGLRPDMNVLYASLGSPRPDMLALSVLACAAHGAQLVVPSGDAVLEATKGKADKEWFEALKPLLKRIVEEERVSGVINENKFPSQA